MHETMKFQVSMVMKIKINIFFLVGVWQHVILYIVTNFVEEHDASTFSVTVSKVE
jgi:hypothetical protein